MTTCMRRTDRQRRLRHVVRAMLTLLAAMSLTGPVHAADGSSFVATCTNSRVGKKVAELLGEWSQAYPFTRVIIGDDGKFGELFLVRVIEGGDEIVFCEATYQLIKLNLRGSAHRVRLDGVIFSVRNETSSNWVRLVNMSTSIRNAPSFKRPRIDRKTHV